jgi:hypothetical protein
MTARTFPPAARSVVAEQVLSAMPSAEPQHLDELVEHDPSSDPPSMTAPRMTRCDPA